ncbi:MOB kinase activator 2 isoform X1 [Ptiloglossa arizonensis]|uniref:MOB kinase activator 2 isoform X1 n=1 Tax=Ptiloglossa arizonensis TaxID=3350558 RepID=UPI003FA0362D
MGLARLDSLPSSPLPVFGRLARDAAEGGRETQGFLFQSRSSSRRRRIQSSRVPSVPRWKTGERTRKARRKEKDAGTTEDPKLYLEEAALERQLPELDLRMLVDLPPGLDYNEWLASHTLALFDHINLVYGTISEFCTMTGCPDMTGPGLRTYLWFDEKGKKTRVAAPQYIDYVMTFTQRTVSDETIFPTKYANEFPSSFESIVRKILRLLYHVVAHIYHCHFREVALLGLHAHLNCVFAHLTLLNQRFNLIDPKETEILGDLEAALLGDSTSSSAPSQTLAIQETPTTTT